MPAKPESKRKKKQSIKVRDQCLFAGMHALLLRRRRDGVVALSFVYKEGYGPVFYGDSEGLVKLPKRKWIKVKR